MLFRWTLGQIPSDSHQVLNADIFILPSGERQLPPSQPSRALLWCFRRMQSKYFTFLLVMEESDLRPDIPPDAYQALWTTSWSPAHLFWDGREALHLLPPSGGESKCHSIPTLILSKKFSLPVPYTTSVPSAATTTMTAKGRDEFLPAKSYYSLLKCLTRVSRPCFRMWESTVLFLDLESSRKFSDINSS